MNRFWMVLPTVALVAACETQEQRMITGTATGMAIGAAVSSDEDRMKGALLGGVAGLVAGTLIGRNKAGECVYRRSDGSTYVGAC
ncbi:MAG: YMGG-like glycine zipper-containing protein [Paracoccaceae bacterium]